MLSGSGIPYVLTFILLRGFMRYEGVHRIKESLPLFELNKTVKPEDAPRLNKQAQAIYELLLAGEVTTGQMASIGLQYNARLYEIRRALWPTGKDVKKFDGSGGNNIYKIITKGE